MRRFPGAGAARRGRIAIRIRGLLERSDFVARFLGKGAMRQVLERVPVRLIDHPHKGVVGAVSWYLRQAPLP